MIRPSPFLLLLTIIAIDEPLVKMQNIRFFGTQSHVAPLIVFADLVIDVGVSFLGHVIDNHAYDPKYFRKTAV